MSENLTRSHDLRRGARPAEARGARTTATARPRWRRHVLGYVLLVPLLLVMVLVIAYPLVNTVLLSLSDVGIIGGPSEFIGLGNYRDVLGDGSFWASVRRSLLWLVGNMVVQTLLAFGAALLMNRDGWLARRARVWVMFPWVIPSVAVAIIWQWMLNSNYGVVSHVMQVAHVISEPLNVFGSTASALAGLILVNSWHWFPLSAVIVLGALQTIPEELHEAARVDGAGPWRTFWSITFPLLGKVLFALGLVGSLWSFNIVDTILLITEGGPDDASTTAPVYVYDQAFKAFHAAEAAAASVVSIGLLGAFALLYMRFARPKEF